MTNPVKCHSRPHENGESGESREGYLAYYPIIYLTFIRGELKPIPLLGGD